MTGLLLDRATVRAEWRRLEAMDRGFTPVQAAYIAFYSWLILQRGIHPDWDTREDFHIWVMKGCPAATEDGPCTG